MRHLLRPAAAVLAGLTLTATLAAPAGAAPVDRGADWLERQLTDGLVVFPQYGDFADYGLTADTALALAAVGDRQQTLEQIRGALAAGVESWTGSGDTVSAGSVAKAVVAAQVTGGNPRDFGGVDLVQRLHPLVSDQRPIVGRIEDRGSSDWNNTFSQALAARGLARAGSRKADEVLDYLLKQQCAKGFFRLNFAAKHRARQGCDAVASAPDTDATAIAVLSLDALPRSAKTRTVRAAIGDATGWLRRTQKRNGSFGGGVATEGSNSNSTGLAAWALGETGYCPDARQGARWVRELQVAGDLTGTPLEGEGGAIAYDRAAYAEAQEEGITAGSQYQWRKAGTDATAALGYLRCG